MVDTILQPHVFYIMGMTLVTLVIAQSALSLVSGFIQFQDQKKRYSRELDLLNEKIKSVVKSKQQKTDTGWSGPRKFVLEKKICEAENIYSYYFKPHDDRPLPNYKPGQFLTIALKIPGQPKLVNRCYSLSDAYHENHYRITVKKISRPDRPENPWGTSSSFMADHLNEGDIIDAKSPSGKFYLDMEKSFPVVLIAGGIGITPMLCMLNSVIAQGFRRDVYFFYGLRHSGEHVMKTYLESIASQYPDRFHLHTCYSQPKESDQLGQDYQHNGFVSVDLLKESLPSNNFQYFICGPGPMMESITNGLKEWQVPDDAVHFEAFGPASVKKTTAPSAEQNQSAEYNIKFDKTGCDVKWTGTSHSILDVADENGVEIDCGCRSGDCGTCATAIRSGEVNYIKEPGVPPAPGTILTCIAVPKCDVVLDA